MSSNLMELNLMKVKELTYTRSLMIHIILIEWKKAVFLLWQFLHFPLFPPSEQAVTHNSNFFMKPSREDTHCFGNQFSTELP